MNGEDDLIYCIDIIFIHFSFLIDDQIKIRVYKKTSDSVVLVNEDQVSVKDSLIVDWMVEIHLIDEKIIKKLAITEIVGNFEDKGKIEESKSR